MTPPDNLLYEYAVVRFVPHIHREEFVNIGLVMLCKRHKWLYGKIKLNDARLKAFDPQVNIETLQIQSRIFEIEGLPFRDYPAEERYRWLTAAKSAMLQTSPSHPGIILSEKEKETPESLLYAEFDRLFAELVSSPF